MCDRACRVAVGARMHARMAYERCRIVACRGVSAACPATARSWQLRHRPACREDARPEEASPSPTRPNSQFRSRACPRPPDAMACPQARCRRFKFNFHTPPLRFRLSSTELGVHVTFLSVRPHTPGTGGTVTVSCDFKFEHGVLSSACSPVSFCFLPPPAVRILPSPRAVGPHALQQGGHLSREQRVDRKSAHKGLRVIVPP